MDLTIKEIKDLAEFVGYTITGSQSDDDLETEIIIEACGKDGLRDGKLSKPRYYRLIAWFSEYPDEGATGLGPEIPDPSNHL